MKRRALWLLVLLPILALPCIGLLFGSEEVTYEDACRHEGMRAQYLRQVLSRAKLPAYVNRVEYSTLESFYRAIPRARTLPSIPGMITVTSTLGNHTSFAEREASVILVLPKAFDPSVVENEIVFLLGLLDHELIHARIAEEGLRVEHWSNDTFRALPAEAAASLYDILGELFCYRNELEQAKRYKLPPSYYRTAFGAYLKYYLRLFEVNPIPDSLRADLLQQNFQSWMLDQEKILFRKKRPWYFEVDGKRYLLPDSVK